MKILCFGSRNWTARSPIIMALTAFPPGTVLIHGDNGVVDPATQLVVRGADKMCGEVGKSLGHVVRAYPYLSQYGLAGGPRRNQQMIDVEHTTEDPIAWALCFHENLSGSKGSRDMMSRVDMERISAKVYLPNGNVSVKAYW